MKKYRIIITFLLLLITSLSFAQKKNEACKYLINGSESFCDGNYKKTIKNLKKLVKKYPGHTLEDEANYAIANAYHKLGKIDKAQAVYLKLLQQIDTEDIDSFGYALFDCNYMQAECRNILIPDFLTSIQHESCLSLANIAFEINNIQLAYEYIRKADKEYRYWFGCGTGDYEEDMRLAQYYSRYYEEMKQIDSALIVVLPFVFEPAAFPTKQYDKVIERTTYLLAKKYGEDKGKALFDLAIENVIQENLGDNYHSSYRYYVLFEGVYIPASPMYLFEHNGNKNEVKEFVKSTTFYKSITQ